MNIPRIFTILRWLLLAHHHIIMTSLSFKIIIINCELPRPWQFPLRHSTVTGEKALTPHNCAILQLADLSPKASSGLVMIGSHFHAGSTHFASLVQAQILVEIVGKSTDTFTEPNKTSGHKMARCTTPLGKKSNRNSSCPGDAVAQTSVSCLAGSSPVTGSSASCRIVPECHPGPGLRRKMSHYISQDFLQ